MTTLHYRRITPAQIRELIDGAPSEPTALVNDHRRSLTSRLRAVASGEHRRLDAWLVERAGRPSDGFNWTPFTARRFLGNAAVRRVTARPGRSIADAVEDEVIDQLLRATSGGVRSGSLAHWMASLDAPGCGLVAAEAVNWCSMVLEAAQYVDQPWRVAPSDAYYDVASARTTLRGRRDLLVDAAGQRVVMRFRCGSPGKSAGPGLRADLTIEALADPKGVSPARIIGLWPDAGVCLAVDGTMDDLRAGARDLVRTAVAQQRLAAARAA